MVCVDVASLARTMEINRWKLICNNYAMGLFCLEHQRDNASRWQSRWLKNASGILKFLFDYRIMNATFYFEYEVNQ